MPVRRGRISITPELIPAGLESQAQMAEWLQLPADLTPVRVEHDLRYTHLIIEWDRIPESNDARGSELPQITPVYQRDAAGTVRLLEIRGLVAG